MGLSEVQIVPVLQSLVTFYTNPKYLAINMSLAYIPTRLFSFGIAILNLGFFENPDLSLYLSIFITTIALLALIVFIYLNKPWLSLNSFANLSIIEQE